MISEGDWVVFRTQSGLVKLMDIRKKGKIQLGKLGSFDSSQLIGRMFDAPCEIYDRGLLRTPEKETILDDMGTLRNAYKDIEADADANNANVVDDRTAQKLTAEEIELMRQNVIKGEAESADVIKTIVENSTTFDKKTEFAKAKYIKKKENKYRKVFVPMRPSIKSICEYYYETAPRKIMEMRIDTLSQMLSMANVHANSKLMVLEDTDGLVISSVLERTNGLGTLLALHYKDNQRYYLTEQMNYRQGIFENVHRLTFGRIEPQPDEEIEFDSIPREGNETEEDLEKRKKRLHSTLGKIEQARKIFKAGKFDGILMAIENNPMNILLDILPCLSSGRPIVLYNPYKEMLLDTFYFMRTSKAFVNVLMTESWMREYQPPSQIGTHPMMSTSGNAGYLLSAIKVVENEDVTPFGKYPNKKQKRDN